MPRRSTRLARTDQHRQVARATRHGRVSSKWMLFWQHAHRRERGRRPSSSKLSSALHPKRVWNAEIRIFMDILTMAKRGEAFYFRPLDQPPTGRACVLSLGSRDHSPGAHPSRRAITLTGVICSWISWAGPSGPDGTRRDVERGFILWQPGAIRHYGHRRRHWLHSWMNVPDRDRRSACRTWHPSRSGPSPRHGAILSNTFTRSYPTSFRSMRCRRAHCRGLIRSGSARFARTAAPVGRGLPRGSSKRAATSRRTTQSRSSSVLWLGAALSVSQFSLVFRAHFGVPPMQYAYRLRLRKAAQLLGESTLAISEVAARVGSEDPLHFSRQFRKYMGQNPRMYRAARAPKVPRKR